jgi:hypothetical protein
MRCIPYDDTSLAKLTNTPVEIVHRAVEVLTEVGLLRRLDSGELFLTQMQEFAGSETDKAAIMRRSRARAKLSEGNNVTAPLPECYPTVTQSKRIEKDIRDIEVPEGTSCPEPSRKAHRQQSEEPFADLEAIPLKDGSEWRPTVAQLEEYKRLYPGVDVIQEFRNMRGWCNANPSKRKTPAGIRRFVTNWLSRGQDRGGRPSRSRDTRYMTTDEYMQATAGWSDGMNEWMNE